jgi:hypothetical protein
VNTAVLLLVFNRPDATARVFEAIRRAHPARLYVAADGPRPARSGDAALCAEVRRIVSAVDWPCTLKTLFRDQNLGCKRGVSSAIDWFFSQEERGIVLEDDCLPGASFFGFCEELLERFKDDPRVFAVQGNFFGSTRTPDASYLFSKMFYMWGWASWADRWRQVRIEDLDLAGVRKALADDSWLGTRFWLRDYWLDVLARQSAGRIDSWGYPVMFHCFANRLFNVTPAANLVLNIGVGPAASRTVKMDCGPYHRQAQETTFPLMHGRPYEGADDLLSFEHRWRIHLTPFRVLRQVMHFRFPRTYEALRAVVRSLTARYPAG